VTRSDSEKLLKRHTVTGNKNQEITAQNKYIVLSQSNQISVRDAPRTRSGLSFTEQHCVFEIIANS
jgi:hypothetical protein